MYTIIAVMNGAMAAYNYSTGGGWYLNAAFCVLCIFISAKEA